jgi:hypothetical protein
MGITRLIHGMVAVIVLGSLTGADAAQVKEGSATMTRAPHLQQIAPQGVKIEFDASSGTVTLKMSISDRRDVCTESAPSQFCCVRGR